MTSEAEDMKDGDETETEERITGRSTPNIEIPNNSKNTFEIKDPFKFPLRTIGLDENLRDHIKFLLQFKKVSESMIKTPRLRSIVNKTEIMIGFETPKELNYILDNLEKYQTALNCRLAPPGSKLNSPSNGKHRVVLNDIDYSIENSTLEDLLKENGFQNFKITRLTRAQNGKPTKKVLLDVESEQIKNDLLQNGLLLNSLGLKFDTSEFSPKPRVLQCFKCYSYGHHSTMCSKKKKCVLCSSEEHLKDQCPRETRFCVNCKQTHRSDSFFCQVRKEARQEIHKNERQLNKIEYATIVKKHLKETNMNKSPQESIGTPNQRKTQTTVNTRNQTLPNSPSPSSFSASNDQLQPSDNCKNSSYSLKNLAADFFSILLENNFSFETDALNMYKSFVIKNLPKILSLFDG